MYGANLVGWWLATPSTELIWIGVGLTAQLLFSMRFLIQWLATEKARTSIIPETLERCSTDRHCQSQSVAMSFSSF
jgi:lipid-A-disaccharide synthase-like uncharacterized protein